MLVFEKVKWIFKKSSKKETAILAVDPGLHRYGEIGPRALFAYRRYPGDNDRVMDAFRCDARLREFGGGERWADVLTILRTAKNARLLTKDEKMLAEADRQEKDAIRDVIVLSRKVWELPDAQEPDGWTDWEALVLFFNYVQAAVEVQNDYLPLPKSLARPAA